MSDVRIMMMTFTATERDYIRRELDMFFSTFLIVSEGFYLKTWHAGLRPIRLDLRLISQHALRKQMQKEMLNYVCTRAR